MANLDLATLMVKIEADGSQAISEMNKVGDASKTQSSKVNKDWADAGKTLTDIGGKLSMAISVPLAAAGTACVKLASDLTETLGKTEVVFGDMADTVIQWSETSVDCMGLAQETALNMASTYGDLGTSMGLTTNQAANMSMNMVQLAADMASFKNISIERANVALQAVYTGETESLKAMGIVMTEANLEQFAMAEGCDKTYKAMSQTEKVMLRYRYVMSMTTNAQGDFVRTGDSLANQTRKLGQNIKELGASFGKILEPAITSIVAAANDVVSWFRNMSDTGKRVVITIAEIAAGIPALLAAVGGIITIIGKLKAGVATLIANPVAAWIAGIVAAATILYAIISSVKGAIDEYNKSVAEMKDKETTVKTTYETLIEVSQDENKDIDAVIRDIKTAISAAEAAGNLIASVKSVEDKDRNVSSVISAIDSALAAKELECKIAGKKKENDPVWKDLNEIKNGLLQGTITIYGEDGNGTLANIEDKIGQINTDLVALKSYEENVIKPQIEVETRTAQENAEKLYEKCAEIANIDTSIDFSFSVSNLGSAEGGDGVMGALFKAIATAKDWSANLTEVQEEFDKVIEKQIEFIETVTASQMMSAWQAYEQGKITLDELYASWDASATQCEALTGKVNGQKDAISVLQDTLHNGYTADDKAGVLQCLEEMAELNPELLQTETYAEGVAAASGRIGEAMEIGAANTQAMSGDTALLNSNLSGLGDDMEGKIKGAYNTYNNAIEDVNATEKEGIDQVDKTIEAKGKEAEALDKWVELLSANYENAETAMDEYKEKYPEMYEALITHYGNEDTARAAHIVDAQYDWFLAAEEYTTLQDNRESEVQRIQEEGNEKRKALETQLGTDLAGITSGFDIATLTTLKANCEKIENVEGVAQINRLLSMEGYCRTAEGLVDTNCFNIVALNNQCISDVGDLSFSAKDAGDGVGDAMGQGIYNGLNSWLQPIINKARELVNQAISAARSAASIHSPSRKTRDLIGKPFVQGIEVGMNDYMPTLLKSTKRNTEAIISAGTGVINSDYKLRPTNTTNIARQGNTTINQTNNFTSRTLSPYEQQQQIRKLNKDLSGVFA